MVAGNKNPLEATEDDIRRLLACKIHIGTKNLQKEMKRYVHTRRRDGIHLIDVYMTWQKLMLAARIITAVENPQDVCVISARPYGQRAVLKFAQYTGCNYIAGRYTPGTLTNQIQERFQQPRILLVTDPRTDHQSVGEAGYVNIPVMALCDTDSPLKNVDVAIPCNNRGRQAIGLLYWLLTREVLRMRGTIVRSVPWEVKVDLFFYRDPEDVLKKEQADAQAAQQTFAPVSYSAPAIEGAPAAAAEGESWGEDTAGGWGDGDQQWGVEA